MCIKHQYYSPNIHLKDEREKREFILLRESNKKRSFLDS